MFHDDPLSSLVLSGDSAPSEPTEPMARRRQVLAYLESRSGVATLDELADALPTADGPDARRRLRIRLHHVDLPWLEAADEIVYEHAEGSVVRLGNSRDRS